MKNNLAEKFQKYVGTIIKNTIDLNTDPTIREISEEAEKQGLKAVFEVQGRQNAPLPDDTSNLLHVWLTSDDLPAGQQGSGWCISRIDI